MTVVPTADRFEPVPDRIAFGMVLFLASEVMFFGALFGAYFFLRVQTAVWPPRDVTLDAVEPAFATVLLVASSGTMVLAERAAERRLAGRLRAEAVALRRELRRHRLQRAAPDRARLCVRTADEEARAAGECSLGSER